MRLIELLDPSRIVIDLRVTSQHSLLETLARLLAPPGVDLAVLEALTEREALGSTALGDGVALPHGRCTALEAPAAAFVRLAKPVNFGAADGRPVDLVCALVTPTHFTEGHLSLLADVATRFSDPICLVNLRAAADVGALRDEMAKWG